MPAAVIQVYVQQAQKKRTKRRWLVETGADEGVGKHKEVNRFPNDNNNKSTLDRNLNYTVIAL